MIRRRPFPPGQAIRQCYGNPPSSTNLGYSGILRFMLVTALRRAQSQLPTVAAVAMIVVAIGLSAYFGVHSAWLRALLGALGLVGILYVTLRIPTRQSPRR